MACIYGKNKSQIAYKGVLSLTKNLISFAGTKGKKKSYDLKKKK